MRTVILAVAAAAAFGLAAPATALAQGPPDHAGPDRERPTERVNPQAQGQGQAQGQARGQGQDRGQGAAAAARARRGGPAPDRATFNRNLVEKATRARSRRADNARGVDVRRGDGMLRVVRDDGVTLFELDAERAEELGYWRAVVAPQARDRSDRDPGGIFGSGDRYPAERGQPDQSGAPAFCRSGEGHPVWGRDWCLDHGFGLGDGSAAWAVDRTIEDIILRPEPQRETLDREGLADVLGDVVFGRLAVQSLVLGADEPLQGRWLREADGPQVLRVHAGDLPVAELVDYERDGRVDRILFNLGR